MTTKQLQYYHKLINTLKNRIGKGCTIKYLGKSTAKLRYRGSEFDVHPRFGIRGKLAIPSYVGTGLGFKMDSPTNLSKWIKQNL